MIGLAAQARGRCRRWRAPMQPPSADNSATPRRLRRPVRRRRPVLLQPRQPHAAGTPHGSSRGMGRAGRRSMACWAASSTSPRPGAAAADAASRGRDRCARDASGGLTARRARSTGRSSDSSTSSQRSDGRCAATVLSRIKQRHRHDGADGAPHPAEQRDGDEHRHGVERAAPAHEGRRDELRFGEVDDRERGRRRPTMRSQSSKRDQADQRHQADRHRRRRRTARRRPAP